MRNPFISNIYSFLLHKVVTKKRMCKRGCQEPHVEQFFDIFILVFSNHVNAPPNPRAIFSSAAIQRTKSHTSHSEPTSGLDPISAAEFDQLILYLRDHLRLTVVMISHDMDSLLTICDRLAVIVDKRIISDNTDLIIRHPHPWIREYFGGVRGRAAIGAT